MSHSIRIIGLSALLLLVFSSTVMQSVADPAKQALLFTKEEQDEHLEKMKNMSEAEKIAYRNEQYELLRQKAAKIGYAMPESPPWSEIQTSQASSNSNSSTILEDESHLQQLTKYRQAAAEKRKAMHERLEKQRQSVQERIAKLVEENALKPTPEPLVRPKPPVPPAVPNFAPVPPPPMGAPYPRFYRVPPPMPFGPGYYY